MRRKGRHQVQQILLLVSRVPASLDAGICVQLGQYLLCMLPLQNPFPSVR